MNMGAIDLQESINALNGKKEEYKAAANLAEQKIEKLNYARKFAVRANLVASGICIRIKGLAPTEWAGDRAQEFTDKINSGGSLNMNSKSLQTKCQDVVNYIDKEIENQRSIVRENRQEESRCNQGITALRSTLFNK